MTHFECATQFGKICDLLSVAQLIENVETSPFLLGESGLFICETTQKNNSYILSLYTAYCTYPQSELEKKESTFFIALAYGCVSFFGKLLLFFNANKIVTIGNQLLSTNFYPDDFASHVAPITPVLCSHFKDHLLVIRNIERKKNASLAISLKQQGWVLFPARIVYVFTHTLVAQRKKRSDTKKDLKLLSSHPYSVQTTNFTDDDFETLHKLYNNVYVDKHSALNALYTPLFFKQMSQNGLLSSIAYRHHAGHIVAFVAVYECENILSTPALGYDTSLLSEPGLYRLVCATLLKKGEDEAKDINFSSGADEFKQRRGGVGTLEYTAIYVNHLPFLRRLFFKISSKLLLPLALKIEKRFSL